MAKTFDQTQTINQDYDRQTLVEIESKLSALDYRIENDLIDLDNAEAYYDLRSHYNERVKDLTQLIKG